MIVFLHGPDTYRSRQKLRDIVIQYEQAHQNKVRSFFFDCKEASVEDVKRAVETISLFEKKKLIIIEGIFQNASFIEWMKREKQKLEKSEQYIIILFERGEIKAKSSNKLYQWLKKHAKQQEFLFLQPAKLKLWIVREFERYGLQVAPRAQEVLARAAGNDLWRLSKDIQTIATFKKSDQSQQVREADVILFVSAEAEADVFATIDAAAQKNKKQAFSLLYRHLKKGDSPHYLFSMLQYQFRTILEIRDLMDKEYSKQEMAREIKLHPYVLQKGMRVAEQFSLGELKNIYQKLFRIDWNVKTGKTDAQGSLDMFFATL